MKHRPNRFGGVGTVAGAVAAGDGAAAATGASADADTGAAAGIGDGAAAVSIVDGIGVAAVTTGDELPRVNAFARFHSHPHATNYSRR